MLAINVQLSVNFTSVKFKSAQGADRLCSKMVKILPRITTIIVALAAVFSISYAAVFSYEDLGANTLYGPGDKVVLLDANSIWTVWNSDKAWLVQFYGDWCHHSEKFAPAYKLLAEQAHEWRDVVQVAVMHAVGESKNLASSHFGIKNVPTLRFFPPTYSGAGVRRCNCKFTHEGLTVRRGNGSTSILKRKLIDLLEPEFPNLLSLTMNSGNGVRALKDLWTSSEAEYTGMTAIVLIFETSPFTSYTGKEIALRLSAHKNIKVFRFFKPNDISRIYAPSQTSWPAAVLLGQDGIPKRLAFNQFAPVDSVCQAVLKLAGAYGRSQPSTFELAKLERPYQPILPRGNEAFGSVYRNYFVVNMEYLLRKLHDSLHTEVLLSRDISGPKLKALQDYLSLLTYYFPAIERNIQHFFDALYSWMKSKETLQATDVKEKLDELENHYNPLDGYAVTMREDCGASTLGHHGYTCGLWKLLHTLGLLAVKVHRMPGALETVGGYAEHFFQCHECTEYFRSMVNSTVDYYNILIEGSNAAPDFTLQELRGEVKSNESTSIEEVVPLEGNHTNVKLCPDCFEKNGSHSSQLLEQVNLLTPMVISNVTAVEETNAAIAAGNPSSEGTMREEETRKSEEIATLEHMYWESLSWENTSTSEESASLEKPHTSEKPESLGKNSTSEQLCAECSKKNESHVSSMEELSLFTPTVTSNETVSQETKAKTVAGKALNWVKTLGRHITPLSNVLP